MIYSLQYTVPVNAVEGVAESSFTIALSWVIQDSSARAVCIATSQPPSLLHLAVLVI